MSAAVSSDKQFVRGDRVCNGPQDSIFEGEIVAVFQARLDHGGEVHCVVEEDRPIAEGIMCFRIRKASKLRRVGS